jgi:UDP-glucose 4-epimerase
MNKLKIGILGANGFVGKELVKHLILKKNFSELHLYSRSFINNIPTTKYIYIHEFDIQSNKSSNYKSLLEIDVLYYLISDSIPASSWGKPYDEITNNLIPFINLIENLKEGNLKNLIFTSRAGTIYGESKNKLNEDSPKAPFSPHGISKLTTEYFLDFFNKKYNINYEIYRISNIYGPGQNTSKGLGLINTILEKSIKNEEIIIFGDGSITRNYIYIKDVAEILINALDNMTNQNLILNLASSDNLSINQIISKIELVTNIKLNLVKELGRPSDNPCISIDNEKLLEYYPNFKITPIEIGILDTYHYLLNDKLNL